MKRILILCILIGASYSTNLEEASQSELHKINKILDKDYNDFIQRMESKINDLKINMTQELNDLVSNTSSVIRHEIYEKKRDSPSADDCLNNLIIDTNNVKITASNKLDKCVDFKNIQVTCQQKFNEILNSIRDFFWEQKNSLKIFTDSLITASEKNLTSCFGGVKNNLNNDLGLVRLTGCIV